MSRDISKPSPNRNKSCSINKVVFFMLSVKNDNLSQLRLMSAPQHIRKAKLFNIFRRYIFPVYLNRLLWFV